MPFNPANKVGEEFTNQLVEAGDVEQKRRSDQRARHHGEGRTSDPN
jgi:hypothetical protein